MMSNNSSELGSDELAPTSVPGYKVSAKKTVQELAKLDSEDESLRKWKARLGLLDGLEVAPSDDPRHVAIIHFALEVDDRPDIIMKLYTPEDIKALKTQRMVIKEGVIYRLKVKFLVQHDVVSGLKYIHVVKRKGIRVDKMEEMLGSYGPSREPYEKKFQPEEALSGIIARGHYDVRSRFIDDDGNNHLDWTWSFEIKKDWD